MYGPFTRRKEGREGEREGGREEERERGREGGRKEGRKEGKERKEGRKTVPKKAQILDIKDKGFFFFFSVLHGLRDLSSQTRDGTHAPTVEVWSLNHWTARDIPILFKGEKRFTR